MSAGQLRELVTLQQRDVSTTPNAYNERVEDWSDLLIDEPAGVTAIGGREYLSAQQTQGEITHRVVLRTPVAFTIKQSNRFVWGEQLPTGSVVTHYLDIKHVIPLVTRSGFTECVCTEHIGG